MDIVLICTIFNKSTIYTDNLYPLNKVCICASYHGWVPIVKHVCVSPVRRFITESVCVCVSQLAVPRPSPPTPAYSKH